MPYHSLQNKAPSAEYDKGHAATFGERADPFCPGCGNRRAWCECPKVFGAIPVVVDESLPPNTCELHTDKQTIRLVNVGTP